MLLTLARGSRMGRSMSSAFPAACEPAIVAAFTDTAHPAYGQAATVDTGGAPHVRTVHFHYLPERAALAFNAYTQSPKWVDLQRQPILEGCYLDSARQVQWRFSGAAELLDPQRSNEAALFQHLWDAMRPDVRSAYWADFLHGNDLHPLGSEVDITKRCPSCGVVVCHLTRWDVYEIDPTDYRKGRRTVYLCESGKWTAQRVSLLHSR